LDMSFSDKWYRHLTKEFYKAFSTIAKQRVRRVE
jgi:hypothetical protein